MIELFTMDGKRVVRVNAPLVEMMQSQGNAPEIIMWGSRFFYRGADGLYTEGMLYVVGPFDEVTL